MRVAVACKRWFRLGGGTVGGEPMVLSGDVDEWDDIDGVLANPPDGGLWVWEGEPDVTGGGWRRPTPEETAAFVVGDDPWEEEVSDG